MNESFFCSSLSTDLILLSLHSESFVFSSLLSRKGFHRAVSMHGRIEILRADSIVGCTGSSVPFELYERVTSVTCALVGLVSNRISVSDWWNCTTLTHVSEGMVLYKIIVKLQV